jgi:molybdopterin-guanine dinucleotide biosynthesis protein A
VIARADLTGIILCGGAARRLGGTEKALTIVGPTSLLGHVRARLAPQVGAIIISANRDLPGYARWGDLRVPDSIEGAGPLGGLHAALAHVETPYAFCCPGDAPLLDPGLVQRLAGTLRSSHADLAMPHDGERTQQLFLLMRTDVRDSLDRYLAGGHRTVLGWTEGLRSAVHDATDIRAAFLNVNTLSALQHAAMRLRSGLDTAHPSSSPPLMESS